MSFFIRLFFFLTVLFFSPKIEAQNVDTLQQLRIEELDRLFQQKKAQKAYKEALPYAKTAMEKALKAQGNQDTLYARMLFNYAYTLDYGLSDFKQAFKFYQEVASIQKKALGASVNYSSTLFALADLYFYNFNEMEQAQKLYFQVEKMRKDVLGVQHDLYGAALNGLASFYSKLGDYEKAASYYLQTKEIWLKNNGAMSESHASILNNLAVLYFRTAQFEAAEKMYLEALRIRRTLNGPLHPDYATALNNLAVLYKKASKEDQAIPLYEEALNIRKKALGEQHPYYATTLNNLAALYRKLGQLEEAEPLYLKAKELKRANLGEDHISYAYSLNSLALLYHELLKYEESAALLNQALYIFEDKLGPSHQDYLTAKNNLALVYERMGRIEEAEKTYKKLLAKLQENQEASSRARLSIMTNLANLYHKNNRHPEAVELMETVIELAKNIYGEDHPDYAATIISYLSTLEDEQMKRNSEGLYYEVLTIYKNKKGDKRLLYANAFCNLAGHYNEQHKLDLAYVACLKALAYSASNFKEVFPEFGALEDSVLDIRNLATNSYKKLSSQDYLRLKDLKIYEIKTFKFALRKLLSNRKKAYENLRNQDAKEAKNHLEEVFYIGQATAQINETIRNSFFSATNKLIYLKKNSSMVEYGIEAALLLDDVAFKKAAFSLAEQNKSILLADASKGNRARNFGDLPDSLALLEIALQEEKEALRKASFEAKTETARQAILQKENQLNTQIEDFLVALKDKFPKYHQLKYEAFLLKAEDVQELLTEEELFLEYFVAEEVVYLFVLTKEAVEVFSISVSQAVLEKKVQDLRRCLSDFSFIMKKKKAAGTLYQTTAYWFYKNLVQPALEVKNAKKLIVVADGDLGLLPFESFLTNLRESKEDVDYGALDYLLRDYSISYNYSAVLFCEAHQLNSNRTPATKGMLAAAAFYPETVDTSLSLLRKPHVVNWRKMLLPLPGAEAEIDALNTNFEGDFLKGTAVNERSFKAEASDYNIIHLAMHGLLHPRLPMLSFLAFTENQDSLEDNFLQAYEIARLQLNTDLVVLSACETGHGAFQQGEGIISLARSFMYAGVPSLVVSFWSVNDQSAALIMQAFYGYLAEGWAKDAALRQAKLDFIARAKSIQKHPIFWASFVQLGDSRPILLHKKERFDSSWKWLLGGLFLVLLGLGLWYKKRWFLKAQRQKEL